MEPLIRGEDYRSSPDEKWLCITGVRYPIGSTVAISFCQSFVHPDFSEIEASLSRTSIPVFAQVEERYGWQIGAVRASFKATKLDAAVAAKLEAVPGEPALEMKRYYLDNTRRTIIIATNIHPADRYTHTLEVERNFN